MTASRESFQPLAVSSPAAHPLRFRLRCLIDLQLATIASYLRPALRQLSGAVLDVGAGQSPWRAWLPAGTRYQGIDVGHAEEFGMTGQREDIVYYDGRILPFGDASFDCALCIEVLEHSADPELLVGEMARVIKPQGTLLLTVPWSARRHHVPHDYHRFTRERLQQLMEQHGFDIVELCERGNDIGAIANKLTVLTLRLLRPSLQLFWSWPLALLCGALALGFIVAAHVSVALGMGSRDDPLGYYLRARRT